MCGLAGFSGKFEPDLLNRMNGRLAHRGPDDQGVYSDPANAVGLAHRRLSIIDVSSRGHQPMWDAQRRVVIVYNGEIYNYRELRERLVADGFKFNSDSDTEVLLNLYLAKGAGMLADLNGIFAFALWDPAQKQLLLARDGLGVKPLYYAPTPQGILFASEFKALIEEPTLDKTLNPIATQAYLTYIWSPAPLTMLKSVNKLEPGCAMLIRDGRIERHWQHYSLPFDAPIVARSDEEAKRELTQTLRDAVARQMIADVPVGFFLSGGVDSSTIVALAKEVRGTTDALECFTIGVEGGQENADDGFEDDLPYAKAVAKHLDIKLSTVPVSQMTTGALERMIYHLDEPLADPAGINVYLISQLARERGIKVLLSGAGGDDIFTGYRRHYALASERYWSWLPRPARAKLRTISSLLVGANPWSRRIRKAFQYADSDAAERLLSYFCWCPPALARQLITNGSSNLTPDVSELVTRKIAALPPNVPAMNQMLFVDQKFYLADECLAYTDKMSMAAGVETRVPLLDREMVALAATLPVHQKQRGWHSKWLLKEVAKDYLPAHIINRPKVGFGVPLRRWMRHELRPMVDDLLSRDSLRATGIFNADEVHKLIQADRSNRGDWSYLLFGVMCVELWHRMFISDCVRSKRVA